MLVFVVEAVKGTGVGLRACVADACLVIADEISNDERLTLPAYFVAGARVNASLAMFEFSFEVNNLFDKQYYTNGSPVDVDYDGTVDGPGYFINAGRNYFFTTRIKF